MGIPENAAKHALYNTGNNSADMATMWYFENLENPGKLLTSYINISCSYPIKSQELRRVKVRRC